MRGRLVSGMLIALALLVAGAPAAVGQEWCPVSGTPGNGRGANWAAAWWDLPQTIDFERGTQVRLRIVGSEWVLVRFLPLGGSPDKAIGIEGDIREVPDDGMLAVTLTIDHPQVGQISVHGGARAWDWVFPAGNGAPELLAVARSRADGACR